MTHVIREPAEKRETLAEITQRAVELWCAYKGIDPEDERDWFLRDEAEEVGNASIAGPTPVSSQFRAWSGTLLVGASSIS
jgi:hypothetical protein